MTLPDSIKEEIEKAADKHGTYYLCNDMSSEDIEIVIIEVATQFYLKALGDRDAIAKAAFEAAQELGGGKEVFFWDVDSYLNSDEYKKLVGDK